jgi:hypothetical protein
MGVIAGQSLFARQATHWPSGAHILAGSALQSVLLTHWTHSE